MTMPPYIDISLDVLAELLQFDRQSIRIVNVRSDSKVARFEIESDSLQLVDSRYTPIYGTLRNNGKRAPLLENILKADDE